jgi:lysophospholipase L1-like esterase
MFAPLPWILSGILACGGVLWAQPAAQAPQAPPGSAATAEQLQRELDAYQHLLNDWAGLTRYGSEDSEIPPPKPGENRVVFLGDQITEYWSRIGGRFFPGKPYLNRGIAGQTTAQMLVRFRQDVIALAPKVVVIQGGSNDIAGAGGPGTKGTLSDNLMSMTDLAKTSGIRVVLAAVTPVCDCYANQTALRPWRRIDDFNDAIKEHAARVGAVYLDFYSALAEGQAFKKALTTDGLLPNEAGYAIMATLSEQAIEQALKK